MSRKVYIKNGEINTGSELKTESGMIFNPSRENFLENGWLEIEEYVLESSETDIINNKIYSLIEECNVYYETCVEQFKVNERLVWIDGLDRVVLEKELEDLIESEESSFNIEMFDINFSPKNLLYLLKEVNIYSLRCKQILKKHLKNISNIEPEDIELYDFTEGYPEQLSFKF